MDETLCERCTLHDGRRNAAAACAAERFDGCGGFARRKRNGVYCYDPAHWNGGEHAQPEPGFMSTECLPKPGRQ